MIDATKLAALATQYDLDWLALDLDYAERLNKTIERFTLVFHAAGPFVHTSEPMVRACLAGKTHYLDITGELPVFESVFARDAEARARGVVLMSGAGYDIVPSDCLARYVAENSQKILNEVYGTRLDELFRNKATPEATAQTIQDEATALLAAANLGRDVIVGDATALLDKGNLVTAASMADMTGTQGEFRVLLASGDVPLEALRSLKGCKEATLESPTMLVVHFDAAMSAPEDIITETVALLAQRGVKLLGVTRGQRLEERVLKLT